MGPLSELQLSHLKSSSSSSILIGPCTGCHYLVIEIVDVLRCDLSPHSERKRPVTKSMMSYGMTRSALLVAILHCCPPPHGTYCPSLIPKEYKLHSSVFAFSLRKVDLALFLDPSVSVIWTIHRKWWWMARWFKLITAHSWWPRSAALRLQVEHKRPALDDGHKQPPGLITKLAKLLKIEKGNCFYRFILGGSPTLDQEASSHI